MYSPKGLGLRGDFRLIPENIHTFHIENICSNGYEFINFNYLEDGIILIRFKNTEDAVESSTQNFSIDEVKVESQLIDIWPNNDTTRAFRVSREGGGRVDDQKVKNILMESEMGLYSGSIEEVKNCCVNDEEFCVVVCDEIEVGIKIWTHYQQKPALFDGFRIERMKATLPPIYLDNNVVDTCKLLFTNIEKQFYADLKSFKCFAENAAKQTIREIMFLPCFQQILVEYTNPIDYSSVLKTVGSRPYMWKMLSVERLRLSLLIQVSYSPVEKREVQRYLKSEAAKLQDECELVEEKEGMVKISFKSHKTVSEMCRGVHVVGENKVRVLPYYEEIGWIPAEHDCTRPFQMHPDDTQLVLHPVITKFLEKFELKQKLEEIFTNHKCKATFHSSASIDEQVVIDVSWKAFAANANSYVDKQESFSLESDFNNFVEQFSFDSVPVEPELVDYFDKDWKEILERKASETLKKFNKKKSINEYKINLVGYKKAVSKVVEIIKEKKINYNKDIENEKKVIKGSFKCKGNDWKLLKMNGFWDSLQTKYDLKYDFKQDLIHYEVKTKHFPQIEIQFMNKKACIGKLNVHFPMFKQVNEFLGTETVKNYLQEIAFSHKTLLEFNDDEVTLLLIRENGDRNVCKQLEESVCLKEHQLEKCQFNSLQNNWKDFGEKMLTTDSSQTVLDLDASRCMLIIVCFETSRKKVVKFMEYYLRNQLPANKRFVPKTDVFLKLIQYDDEAIKSLSSFSKGNTVQVVKQDGIELGGTESDLDEVIKELNNLESSFSVSKIPVNLNFARRLLTDNFLLEGLCRQHKIFIELNAKSSIAKEPSQASTSKLNKELQTSQIALKGKNQLKISIIRSSIADQSTDVIFNTCDKSLDMTKTVISKAISKQAGSGLTNELKSLGLTLSEGQVQSTKGHGLKCKRIYHGSCENWKKDAQKAEEVLSHLVNKSLEMVAEEKLRSISLPAIGTGKLGMEAETCARIMFRQCLMFSSGKSSLQKVVFVIYHTDYHIWKEFEDYLKFFIDSHEAEHALPKQQPIAQMVPKNEWKCGDVQLMMRKSDLTDSTEEAIVNNTNRTFNLHSGALSKSILQKAGQAFEDECKTHGDFKNGWMVITGAGNLQCKKVVHVVGSRVTSWKDALVDILNAADKEGLISIALPPLGTGNKNVQVDDIAEMLIRGVLEFGSQPRKHLKRVVICLLDDVMMQTFMQKAEYLCKTDGTFWDTVKNTMKKAVKGFSTDDYKKKGDSGASTSSDANTDLSVYSFHGSYVDDLQKSLEDYRLKKTAEKYFDTRGIINLDEEILQLEKDYFVKIEKKNNGIILKGEANALLEAITYLSDLKNSLQNENQKKQRMEFYNKHVTWSFTKGESCQKYPMEATDQLENSWSNNSSRVIVKDEQGFVHSVFLKEMKTAVNNDYNKLYKVSRQPENIDLPKTWTTTSQGNNLVPVDPTSTEYDKVVKHFTSTANNLFTTIIKVERVQNESLYKQFVVRKRHMQSYMPGSMQAEQRLWHGTSDDNIIKINSTNFNRSFCGVNGTAYGNGVYFAVNSSYSIHGYCRANSNSEKVIYQVQVLTGQYTVGQSGLKEPPIRVTQGQNNIHYDSVVDKQNTPSIFVVFSDSQAYPEYLITFK